eukprot:1338053-Amorphochlora_amoeboformis.AAC.2
MAAARRKAKNKRKVADADDYKTKKHKKQSTSTSSKPSKGPSQPKLTQSVGKCFLTKYRSKQTPYVRTGHP